MGINSMAIGGSFGDPGTKLAAVAPNDSTDLTGVRAVYVGGAGNLALMGIHDSAAVTLSSVPAGSLIPVQVKRVMSTNTTATNIVAIY